MSNTVNGFWNYVTPLFGAYVADQYLGRYLTIQYSIAISLTGHLILLLSAIPPVLVHPHAAIALLIIGIIVMGVGTGGFKSNISPLIAEQYQYDKPYVRVRKDGKKEIIDPAVTASRIYIYFYFFINIGSLTGSIAMVYAEHFVGFWLSFMLPSIIFLTAPTILWYFKKQYTLQPPTGSVAMTAFRLVRFAFKGQWSWNLSKM